MKANELMIGDWVQIKHGRKLQLELDQFFAQGKHEFEGTPIDYFAGFQPIPLTKEILKKNGFKYDSYDHCYRKEDFELGIEIGNNGFYESGSQDYFYMVFSCVFVHELQHALRVGGLTDFADDFIVELEEDEDDES